MKKSLETDQEAQQPGDASSAMVQGRKEAEKIFAKGILRKGTQGCGPRQNEVKAIMFFLTLQRWMDLGEVCQGGHRQRLEGKTYAGGLPISSKFSFKGDCHRKLNMDFDCLEVTQVLSCVKFAKFFTLSS